VTPPDHRPPLTARQLDYLLAIQGEIARTGLAPTFHELGRRLGIGRMGALHTLRILRSKGYVTWEPGKGRTLQLIPAPSGAIPDEQLTTSRGVRLRRVWWGECNA
jgi:SOS-response transcriptional repressor LexA